MNNLIRKSATPFGALAVAVFFLIIMFIVSVSGVTHAVSGDSTQTGRLITIHDSGIEKIILSQASTIGDALNEAGIVVDVNDLVEPAAAEKLVASNYQVNIYRSRPVIIVDGNIRQKVMTAYQTAEQIVSSAGIVLYPEDKTEINRVDNVADGAGLQLVISRAMPFSFTLYGKTATSRTQAKTVGEMLVEKGIVLNADDRVLPIQDRPITENLSVRVWREGKQTVTNDEPFDFAVEKIQNADQPVSYRHIVTPGVAGVRSATYEVMIEDGQEVNRIEIASVVVKPAIKQVEVVGVKGKYTTPSENENITWDFLISNGFSRTQTAGIMGNLMQEHRFNTYDTTGGYGIVQWTGGRRTELMKQAYPENIYTQLNFLMHELNTGYAYVQTAIKASTTLEEAVIIFQNKFERCGICMESNRITYARNILASH